jgi:hypothetical protein
MNFDFHPRWMRRHLQEAGFLPGRTLSVSHFRLPLLKKIVPTALLAGFDSLLQGSGRWLQVAPSVLPELSSRRAWRPNWPTRLSSLTFRNSCEPD